MEEEELKSKREGSFITGLPSISSDPVTGVWYGGSGYFIENGKKTNPLFAYSPYMYRIAADVYQSSVGAKYYGAGIDLVEADMRLKAAEEIADTKDIRDIREKLDQLASAAREEKTDALPQYGSDLKSSFVRAYLKSE